jgi:hypothetical protein
MTGEEITATTLDPLSTFLHPADSVCSCRSLLVQSCSLRPRSPLRSSPSRCTTSRWTRLSRVTTVSQRPRPPCMRSSSCLSSPEHECSSCFSSSARSLSLQSDSTSRTSPSRISSAVWLPVISRCVSTRARFVDLLVMREAHVSPACVSCALSCSLERPATPDRYEHNARAAYAG